MRDNSSKASDKKKVLHCAIYTRKSHEEGLEQEFNSLDAQRESAEAYIESQKLLGWKALPDRYDDGGYSGGTMERPALQRLLADIDAGKVDVIVVYKIDRLSRALLDFTKMIDMFNDREVCFVSVTQQISTTDSTGRMMFNVLMTFAQYEREVIAERIRDKDGGCQAAWEILRRRAHPGLRCGPGKQKDHRQPRGGQGRSVHLPAVHPARLRKKHGPGTETSRDTGQNPGPRKKAGSAKGRNGTPGIFTVC